MNTILTLFSLSYCLHNSGFFSELVQNTCQYMIFWNIIFYWSINKLHYNDSKVSSEINKLRYFKLPYIDKYSEQVQKKIAKLCKQYCNEDNVKIVFTSFKISNFSVKDSTPYILKSFSSLQIYLCKMQILLYRQNLSSFHN